MSNIIELEASYHLKDDYSDLLNKIKQENFILKENVTEEDTYYTDKELKFIDERICLRTRKINDDFLELTYKPKSDDKTEKYKKKEVNIELNPNDYEDTKYVIKELGYIEYVSFKKYRKTYFKKENNAEYNIMIDTIDGIGNFVELEILVNSERQKEEFHDELDDFVKTMHRDNLKEKEKPYRVIVKDYIDNNK